MKQVTCRASQKNFTISDKDLEFYDTISPIFGGKKYPIPAPTLCPEERMRRRICFRNESTLYHRECAISKKPIVSIYSPAGGYSCLSQDIWWSDTWNPFDYGRDFDFSKSFFEQFGALLRDVPKMGLVQQGDMPNSEYCNCASYNKDCYLIFNASDNEGCLHGSFVIESKKCIDTLNIFNCENCYEITNASECYRCFHSQNLKNCQNMHYCFDCENSKNSFGCVGLRNKIDGYYLLNKKVSEEQFSNAVKNPEKVLSEYKELLKNTPRKYTETFMCDNSTGGYIFNSKNSELCWDATDLEDCKYCNNVREAKNCYDYSYYGIRGVENIYECEGCGHGLYNIRFSKLIWGNSQDMMYCYECYNSKNCFGCNGLKGAEYCVFNKQYTKEQYEELVPKIIEKMIADGQWGEFFPASMSPFGYNETVVNDYFPITKDEALKQGFNWNDYEPPFPKVEKKIPAEKLPRNIADIPDDILNWAIICPETGKPFKIMPQELEFYRKHNLPIPQKHPRQRYLDRMNLRNPRKLFDRKCDKCGIDIKTTYSPDRPEKVYCEECYNKEVY